MDIDKAVEQLANLVYDTRTSLNMSQRQFAKLFSTTSSSISNLENGNYKDLPEHRTLNRFAIDIMKIEYSELIKTLETESEPAIVREINKPEVIKKIWNTESIDELLEFQEQITKKIQHLMKERDGN